jgi:glycosyltransferase involved in cell wall biosynthesis
MTPNNTDSKILLFIPAYNCEKQIVRVLGQLDGEVREHIAETIVVNNRSTDGTEKAVLRFSAEHPDLPLALLRNRDNYNLGGSHKVAFSYALEHNFSYIIVLHGDDQGDIHDILPYLQDGSFQNYDSLLGSRFEKESKLVNYSAFRIFGNHVFNLLISIVAGKKLSDLGSGLNMYSARYLADMFYLGFPDSLTFNVYMLLYGVHSKSRFRFFPLSWREEDQISNAKFVRQSVEILKLMLQYLFARKTLFQKADKVKTYLYDQISAEGDV